jgi:hypothetical protein
VLLLRSLRTAAENQDGHTRAITLRAWSVQTVRLGAPRHAVDLADAAVTAADAEDMTTYGRSYSCSGPTPGYCPVKSASSTTTRRRPKPV